MADDIQYVDIDGDEYSDTPKPLRDAYKALKADHEALRSQASTLQGQLVDRELTSVLSGFKNPERVKRDLLGDKINPLDKSALDQWLGANAADYARAEGTPDPAQAEPQVPQAEIDQQRAMNNLGSNYRAPADMGKLEAVDADLPDNFTSAQLKEAYRKHGM